LVTRDGRRKKEFAEAITRVYEAVPIPRFYAAITRLAGGPNDGTGAGKTTP
jgi:hypothetical protein